jgi:DNA-binding NarL/FixJ family response regulator
MKIAHSGGLAAIFMEVQMERGGESKEHTSTILGCGSMGEFTQVLIVDDHPLVRFGIRTALADVPSLTVVGEAADGHTALQLVQAHHPHIVLLDISLPASPPPTDLVAALRMHSPTIKILILTAYDDDVFVRSLLDVGVDGYMLKDEATDTIIQAIHTLVAGGTWFSRTVTNKLVAWGRGAALAPTCPALTEREQAVLRLIAAERTNYEIAQFLALSEKTVAKYLTAIFVKLGVESRVGAAVYAVRHGLMDE